MSVLGTFLPNEVTCNSYGRPVATDIPLVPDILLSPLVMSSSALATNTYEARVRAERRVARVPVERRNPRVARR
jgi:hypothetical protein